MGSWVAIGVGVGAALGIAMDQLAVWTAVGAGIGDAVGAAMSGRTRSDR